MRLSQFTRGNSGPGTIVNMVWVTILGCGLYWGIHEQVKILNEHQEAETKARLVAESVMNQRIGELYQQAAEDRRLLQETTIRLSAADDETRRQLMELLRRTK